MGQESEAEGDKVSAAMKGTFRKGCIAAGAMIGIAAPSIAVADPSAGVTLPPVAAAHPPVAADQSTSSTTPCPSYSLSQPFLSWWDSRKDTLLAGESVDNVGGEGWQLSNGAYLTTTTLADGSQGQVLDMPAGSVAVAPPMCVNDSAFPRARTMVSDVSGKQGIAVSVSYPGTGLRARQLAAGRIKNTRSGFRPSKPIMLHAGSLRGVHKVVLRFVARGGEYQLYNLYIDPLRIR
jgi:hypothetical protein